MQCVRCLTENVEKDPSAKISFAAHEVWNCKSCGISWEAKIGDIYKKFR